MADNHSKNVDIIVVNWNSASLTLKAIAPYLNYNSKTITCNVIIVDNASSDDSVLLFEGKGLNVIYNTQNLGFGKACNLAYKESKADYLLLLNPDTVSSPETLEALVDFLESNSKYAVVGPRQVDEKGKVIRTCGRFPSFKTAFFDLLGLSKKFPATFTPAPIMSDWDHSSGKDVDHVMGSYMLIRKSVPDKIGFMDDDYFMYMEDLDLSKRISEAGYKTYYYSDYSIYHECGATGESVKSQRLFYSLVSRRIYWKKHFGKMKTAILTFLSLTVEPLLRIMDFSIKERRLVIRPITEAYKKYISS